MRSVWMGIFAVMQNILLIVANDEIALRKDESVGNSFTRPVFGSDVNVTCGAQEIKVTISEKYLEKYSDVIASRDQICLDDQECCVEYSDEEFSVKITKDFSKCGNKISVTETINSEGKLSVTHYKFTNRLIYGENNGAIDRDIILVNFHCLYPAEMMATARPSNNLVSSHLIKIKKVSGEIAVSKSKDFNQEQAAEIGNREPVFVRIKIKDPGFIEREDKDVKVVSVVKQCFVNDAEIEHQIVENGCSTYERTEVYSTGTSLESFLKVDMNKIVSPESSNATIRCMMDLCVKTKDNICKPKCLRRRRRSLYQKPKQTSSEQKYVLEFKGEEFSATIFLKNKPHYDFDVKNQEIKMHEFITKVHNSTKEAKQTNVENGYNKKFLLTVVLGGLAVFLLLVLTSAMLFLYKQLRNKKENV